MSSDKLINYLESKKCFKLICGAGNKNFDEITKLCALYAAAGCRFFDVNASVEAVRAAKKGIKLAKKEDECFICVSVGTKDDPHISKFRIDCGKCISCGNCEKFCMQNAISKTTVSYTVNAEKCTGCGKCAEICSVLATERYSDEISFSEILPPLIKEGIDCIEYHTITDNENEVMKGWKKITDNFGGVLSVCSDRSKLSNEKLIDRLNIMKNSCSNILIVQADGAPMSGGADDFRTTLQAVAAADIVLKANITPYVIMSGGTNSKTMELAKQCGLDVCGFAAGSYARKIVKEYIEKEDFFSNKEIFYNALETVKKLVNTVC